MYSIVFRKEIEQKLKLCLLWFVEVHVILEH